MEEVENSQERISPEIGFRRTASVVLSEMQNRPFLFYGWILFNILFDIFLIINLHEKQNFLDFLGIFFSVSILPLAPLIIWFSIIEARVISETRQNFWKTIANKKGWVYKEMSNIAEEEALFLNAGDSGSISNVVIGDSNGLPVRVFESKSVTGSGKNKKICHFSCFAFKLAGNFPHLYLAHTGNMDSFISNSKYEINLPGDLGRQFSLYAPKEYEIEALQLFTPDLLLKLSEVNLPHDIELVDHEILIFINGLVNSYDQFESDMEIAHKVANMISERADHMRFTPIPHSSYLLLDMSWRSSIGSMLKKGTTWFFIFYAIIFGVLTYLIIAPAML